MHTSKSSAIEDFLSKTSEDDGFEYESQGHAGRKPTSKAPARPAARNTQAWRAIEDMKEKRRLDGKLKEVYEEE
ncbi:MAG TPA: hypothetical protein VGO35_05575 [Gammaproteobacteria bacterium]|jgi:hypothetical protein|nr:hypothetical protein [Gammaproteobacteria bacterium]